MLALPGVLLCCVSYCARSSRQSLEPWRWRRRHEAVPGEDNTEALHKIAKPGRVITPTPNWRHPTGSPSQAGCCSAGLLLKFRWKETFRYHLLHSAARSRANFGTGLTSQVRLGYLPHLWCCSLGIWLSCFSALTGEKSFFFFFNCCMGFLPAWHAGTAFQSQHE